MKVLIVVLSVAALASAQQQLIDPYFNDGLLQYNDWQANVGVPNVYNPYGFQPVPQFLPGGQQFPLVQPGFAGPQLLPPLQVPFPAQLPFAQLQQPGQLPVQLPVPQRPYPAVPVQQYNAFQQPAQQFQMVRHGLPYSDAAAVSYSHYTNAPQASGQVTLATPVPAVPVSRTPSVGVNGGASVPVVSPAATPSLADVSVVKDIATFGTEYGTGADKSPVARYEARNAGSVHVAPLPGHTVDQKLVAPGTVDQK